MNCFIARCGVYSATRVVFRYEEGEGGTIWQNYNSIEYDKWIKDEQEICAENGGEAKMKEKKKCIIGGSENAKRKTVNRERWVRIWKWN